MQSDNEMSRERRLAVIVHADVVGSTAMVQRDEGVAHARITDAFARFSALIARYRGTVHEIRGDALIAEFARASDAVTAALAFQRDNEKYNSALDDGIVPAMRVGIALGEVVVADNTVTGAGVVLAQRIEQHADAGGVCVSAAVHETLPRRLPIEFRSLGDVSLKGFEEPVRIHFVSLRSGAVIPEPGTSAEAGRRRSPLPSGELTLPDQPSVAVLPFACVGTGSDIDAFADGLAEDVISGLSRIRELFVIDRNSTLGAIGPGTSTRRRSAAISASVTCWTEAFAAPLAGCESACSWWKAACASRSGRSATIPRATIRSSSRTS